jgi:hypothetical protein
VRADVLSYPVTVALLVMLLRLLIPAGKSDMVAETMPPDFDRSSVLANPMALPAELAPHPMVAGDPSWHKTPGYSSSTLVAGLSTIPSEPKPKTPF